ncbi:citrate-binding protein-like [Coffea arabica]|uniref:Citrate-binding protein-like n=1 Tax=Coffea arabica TaxID=13443 RepID=A0A6P6UJ96_COFAR|nr:citrate-binding protein-like [Coffea arabica]
MTKFSIQNVVFLTSLMSLYTNVSMESVADPTEGFTNVPLTEYNFEIQRPYDIPLNQRYSYENGTRRLWVYADDKPHNPNSHTMPRTEIRIRGLDYSSGVWQFEGYGFVPNGTSGATIVQIHGASHGATTTMLRIIDGNMNYYCGAARGILATQKYDKWFKVNLIHDVDGGKVTVYIDGEHKVETKDGGPGDLYFKCGVYAASTNISYFMESRWRDIKIYKK